jgi:hypothetical protein
VRWEEIPGVLPVLRGTVSFAMIAAQRMTFSLRSIQSFPMQEGEPRRPPVAVAKE